MAEKANDFTLIKAAHLIDGEGGQPIERGAILIENDIIKQVGSEENVVPPEGSSVTELNYDSHSILPGLIDSHVHLIGIGDGRAGDELTTLPDEILTLQAAKNARAHLYSGVTTVRDCGAKNRTTLELKEAVNMGITVAPRLILAGRPIAIIGGHLSYFGIQATGPDECIAAVRQLVKEGVDFIKITASGGSTRTSVRGRPSFNLDELKSIVDEAHKFGRHSAAHCTDSQSISNAISAGIDTVIHGRYVEADGSNVYRPELTEQLVERNIFVNPTLHQGRERIWQLERKAETELLSEEEQESIDTFFLGWADSVEFWGQMLKEGVKLVAGSDASWLHYKLGGTSFQDEISAHVDVGMSPMEAIVSGTSDAAKSCWIDDQVGTLSKNKKADILIVEGNPANDIRDLSKVADVFLDGEKVDRNNQI